MTSKVHTVAPSQITSALYAAGYKAYDFDLIEAVSKLHSPHLRRRLLSRIAFVFDAYINVAIQRAIASLKLGHELDGTAKWDTYQAFLSYVAGIAANRETMEEAGMNVEDLRVTVQKLYDCRVQVYDIIEHTELPNASKPFEVPSITDWMRNPRARRDDATTLAKLMSTARLQATDDETGAIDVDLEKQLMESYDLKRSAVKRDQLKWDKQRGELAAVCFEALGIRDDTADVGYAGENEHPFMELEPLYQFKVLDASPRYISDTLIDLVDDRKVTAEEHAKSAIESRPLLKAVKEAAKHPRFAKVIDEIAERS